MTKLKKIKANSRGMSYCAGCFFYHRKKCERIKGVRIREMYDLSEVDDLRCTIDYENYIYKRVKSDNDTQDEDN